MTDGYQKSPPEELRERIAKAAANAKAKFDNEIEGALAGLLAAGTPKEETTIHHYPNAPKPITEIFVGRECKYRFTLEVSA